MINNSLPALTQEYSGYETTRQRLWYLRAKRMVCILPLFCGHSAKITVLDNAACNLLRTISLVGLAFTPKGCSDRISPTFSKIRCWSGAFSFGCTMSSPEVIICDGLIPAYCRHRISFGLKLLLTIEWCFINNLCKVTECQRHCRGSTIPYHPSRIRQ